MSSIRLWAGWTFPLCSLRHMKCFFFPVFRPISIHSLSFLLNMSPLILKDVCVHEGLVRQNMYKHMCTCKHASTRDTHADSRVHTHTQTHTCTRICTSESFDKADCAACWRVILLKREHENGCCARSKGLFGAVARLGSVGPSLAVVLGFEAVIK